MQVDYFIVGIGLSGISFCEQLVAKNISFIVFDDASQKSSFVAGGLYNPVVLKRFTPVWKSEEQLEQALSLYQTIENRLKIKLDYKIPVYRRFTSLEEQNNWFASSDKPSLSKYLSVNLVKNYNTYINANHGFGEVFHTGRIDVKMLIKSYISELNTNNQFVQESFDYNELIIEESFFQYKNFKAKHIVFCDGFGVSSNPFFSDLPLVPTKGELLIISAPLLKIDYILKSDVFLVPLGNDLYLVGATYDWDDTSQTITLRAKDELITKLNKFITCSYDVVDQLAGIRPTVKDRRPLVGQHRIHKNMYVLNGLGTRGVMIGPYVARKLYDFIENKIPLEKDIDINRFN